MSLPPDDPTDASGVGPSLFEPAADPSAAPGESLAAASDRAAADDDTPELLKVHLPAFDGPLDLLLHLIKRNKLNIYDIPIALITDQYHQTLDLMHELDLEVAGEFIYMAALLIHIKSRMLLPKPEGVEPEEDPRQELIDRLLEYRRVKEIAEGLHELETVERGVWLRQGSHDRQKPDSELPLAEASLFDLVDAFQKVIDRYRLAHPPAYEVSPQRFSVKEKMLQIMTKLEQETPIHLLGFLSEAPSKGEIVVLFVGTLELVRLQLIRAYQEGLFGEILLHRTGEAFDLDTFEDYYQ